MAAARVALCPAGRLSLRATLTNGQCFGWRLRDDGDWVGVLQGRAIALTEAAGGEVSARALDGGAPVDPAPLRDFFQLGADMRALREQWGLPADLAPGTRILRQDPVECLFSFIASANNNVARIAAMVHRLRVEYGARLASPDLHAFPSPAALAERATETRLRELGWGYRARYVVATAKQLQQLGGEEYLLALRAPELSDEHVRAQLMQFTGVGRKVADCVALFSLDRRGVVPVDTHVFKMAKRAGAVPQDAKLTPALYGSVVAHFEGLYGESAGWAHSVLFGGELSSGGGRGERGGRGDRRGGGGDGGDGRGGERPAKRARSG